MKTLREYIADARNSKTAIGHFNISTVEMFWGIVNASKEAGVPVIIGVSEGERNFIGVKQVVALVRSVREEEGLPVFLNADHTYSFEKVKEAIDAGFDSVIFDGAKLSIDENTKISKQCVDYARACGRDVLVEAEMGYIGQSSKVLDEIPEGVKLDRENLTHPDIAKKFVDDTGIDCFAPAVGNIHGMLRAGRDPDLDIGLIKEISDLTGLPLVLHGGSGTSDEDFVKAVEAGIAIVHVSTEIRVAYRKAIQLALQESPEEVAPYKYMKSSVSAVTKVVVEKIALFNKNK